MKKRIFVDVHCLQTVPPSCVNRDDTGAPKTAVYGGVTRSRVSSQAWKKAIRDSFSENLPEEELGVRTKKIVKMVKDEILKLDPSMKDEKAEKVAIKSLENAGLKIKNANVGTDALMLLSKKQASALAKCAVDEADKAAFKTALQENPSLDLALFGRMVASDPSLNYDAAAQVAHAISTHAAPTEYDYFTAVDDLGDAGAGHIGVGEFNSSTLYRYATVNVMELYKNLGQEAVTAVQAFLKGFVYSMPTGKLNSYANWTTPCAVYIAIREDQPVSLSGAFEKAVPASPEGYEKRSEERLVEKAKKLYGTMIAEPYAAYVTGDGLEELAKSQPFQDVINAVGSDLDTLLNAGEQ